MEPNGSTSLLLLLTSITCLRPLFGVVEVRPAIGGSERVRQNSTRPVERVASAVLVAAVHEPDVDVGDAVGHHAELEVDVRRPHVKRSGDLLVNLFFAQGAAWVRSDAIA